jgi:hypothetical protein
LESYSIRIKVKTENKYWPKAANAFTRRLKQISSNLLDGFGINVQISRITGSNTSHVIILKIPPEPPEPPEDQNHEGKPPGVVGGISTLGENISEISPEKEAENRAQNGAAGDTGDTGDIYRMIEGDPPQPNITSDNVSNDNTSDIESNIYEHLIETKTLPNIGEYFTCIEHPNVWNKDLTGLIMSHFIPFH